MPEFIDPVLAKTSPKSSFSMSENERFGLVFAKTRSIHSGTDLFQNKLLSMSLSKVWNENERFRLVFTKKVVFVPKTGSLHTGTGGYWCLRVQ